MGNVKRHSLHSQAVPALEVKCRNCIARMTEHYGLAINPCRGCLEEETQRHIEAKGGNDDQRRIHRA